MNHHLIDPSRRRWLKMSGLSACGALSAGTLGSLLVPTAARAADYKALVCVFLYGGNDGLNTIVPTDSARYTQYRDVRQELALPASSLLPLSGTNYGMHPALAALQDAWADKRLATLFNVGPLKAPLTKAAYRAAAGDPSQVPGSLFSHSDQQALWETGTASPLTRTGWGGRAAEALATTNPVISAGGNGRFGLSASTGPLVVPEPGAVFGTYELGSEPWRLQDVPATARANAIQALYTQTQDSGLRDAHARMQRYAFEVTQRLGAIVKTQPGDANANPAINAGFAPVTSGGRITSPLAKQLYQVAKLIANRGTVQGDRQIFFVQLNGFDTHSGQAASDPTQGVHARLLKQVGDAMAAFDNAMQNLGMGAAVTQFTQSDFGRTFKPNGSGGTDHAWGNHQLVLGGAVKGGSSYGTYPLLELGGADDIGVDPWELHGRWIPTASVDQYAATLLRWFGAAEPQLDAILPNLVNFGGARSLGFV